MDKEAIEKIEQLVDSAKTVKVGGLEYSATDLTPVLFEPKAKTLVVHSLRGFCGFINNDIDDRAKKGTLVHVFDPVYVTLISPLTGKKQERELLVRAVIDEELKTFPFGEFMTQEEFAISFRSLFVRKDGDDFDYVLSYASKLTGGTQIDGNDDGISQTVAVKRGMSGTLTGKETLKAIVRLSPYRTFREIEQPESEFILRVRLDNNDIPKVAIFEADGGAWRNTATQRIAEYIQSLVSVPVIA